MKEQKPKITDERDALVDTLKSRDHAMAYLVAAAATEDDVLFQIAIMNVAEAWHVEKNELAGRYVRKRLSPTGRNEIMPEIQDVPRLRTKEVFPTTD